MFPDLTGRRKPPSRFRALILGFDHSELGLQNKTNTYIQIIPGLKVPLINSVLFALDHKAFFSFSEAVLF